MAQAFAASIESTNRLEDCGYPPLIVTTEYNHSGLVIFDQPCTDLNFRLGLANQQQRVHGIKRNKRLKFS